MDLHLSISRNGYRKQYVLKFWPAATVPPVAHIDIGIFIARYFKNITRLGVERVVPCIANKRAPVVCVRPHYSRSSIKRPRIWGPARTLTGQKIKNSALF